MVFGLCGFRAVIISGDLTLGCLISGLSFAVTLIWVFDFGYLFWLLFGVFGVVMICVWFDVQGLGLLMEWEFVIIVLDLCCLLGFVMLVQCCFGCLYVFGVCLVYVVVWNLGVIVFFYFWGYLCVNVWCFVVLLVFDFICFVL